MGKINQLPLEVIAIIAAGEVVERPAQIIKELIENALDAQSTHIEVRLTNSGIDQIIVSDNGEGMSESDLGQSWLKHTTSKIATKEDLAKVLSNGFRGEALASIAGVSKLEIQSRQKGVAGGYKIVIKDGKLLEAKPVGIPEGTTVIVSKLFANIPARKKFLKNPNFELKKIIEVVTELSLINHHVSFSLFNNDQNILSTGLEKESVEQRIEYLLGTAISTQLLAVNFQEATLSVVGYISTPQLSRKKKTNQFLFINRRPVVHEKICQLIKKTYGSLLEPYAHPIFILDIQINPEEIDSNVHPQKRVVEFLNEQEVLFELERVIEQTLQKNNLTYQYRSTHEEKLALRDRQTINHTKQLLKEVTSTFDVKETHIEEEIIQVDKTYLIYQTQAGLVMLDQHAAHERILFEQFKEAYLKQDKRPVALSSPVLLDISKSDLESITSLKKLFHTMGFMYETKNHAVYLTHVPELLLKHDYLSLITEIIDASDGGMQEHTIDSQTIRVLNFLACRNAIMAGEYLTMSERKNLINKLDEMTGLYTCPHGRPIKVVMSVPQLEKLFLRK
jgi:DNA mismatch repair protein MutL